jgi:predicted RNA-binding protein
MRFWRVTSSTVANIEQGLKHKVWGFSPTWEMISKTIKKGDRIVLYTSETRSFLVVCEVTEEHYVDSSPIWQDDIYPHRIGIEPLPVSQKPLELKQVRERTKRPKFGVSFMPAIVRLTPEDFNILLRMMTEK